MNKFATRYHKIYDIILSADILSDCMCTGSYIVHIINYNVAYNVYKYYLSQVPKKNIEGKKNITFYDKLMLCLLFRCNCIIVMLTQIIILGNLYSCKYTLDKSNLIKYR